MRTLAQALGLGKKAGILSELMLMTVVQISNLMAMAKLVPMPTNGIAIFDGQNQYRSASLGYRLIGLTEND